MHLVGCSGSGQQFIGLSEIALRLPKSPTRSGAATASGTQTALNGPLIMADVDSGLSCV